METQHLDDIDTAINALPEGRGVPWPDFANRDDGVKAYVDRYLLINPNLACWVIRTPDEVVKTTTPPEEVPARVLRELMRRCKPGLTKPLVKLASLPAFFEDKKQEKLWAVVGGQLSMLDELLDAHGKEGATQPDWLRVLVKSPPYLLTLIHSRLLLPTVLVVPPWNDPWIDQPNSTQSEQGNPSDEEEWPCVRQMLVGHNAALWRYRAGIGSKVRALEVVEALEQFSGKNFDYRILLAARIAAEYIELATNPDLNGSPILQDLDAVWESLRCSPHSTTHKNLPQRKPFLEAVDFELPDNVDLSGVENVAPRFANGHAGKFRRLIEILADGHGRTSDQANVWICLNATEINKRFEQFRGALDDINSETDCDGLSEMGVVVRQPTVGAQHVVAVEPSKWLAMRNRLPEVTKEQMERMHEAAFSATAIFDTLLAEPLADDESTDPMWMTRVYRILDTMADFVPQQVQLIRVGFDGASDARPYSVPLPLPVDSEDAGAKQDLRKKIVALYVLTTAVNHAVTLGTRRIVFDCGIVGDTGKDYAFNNADLKRLLDGFVKEYGFDRYVDYLQATNFDSFAADPGIVGAEQGEFEFASADTGYGRFLGIDIGGSFVKVALFVEGEWKDVDVHSFATFPEGCEALPLEKFVERLLLETKAKLGADLNWNALDGIGISWPGAVRESRITGFSGTLGRLIVEIDGQPARLNANSRPEHVQSVLLVEAVRNGLREHCPGARDSLIVAMENDGNAEAYGNFCILGLGGNKDACWRLIMKLGTSLAGGSITKRGGVSDHIAEFAKPIFDFREAWRGRGGREGAVREFVSSKGVRNLTRTFRFEGKDVFGNLGGLNSSNDLASRIEAVEVGELLDFCTGGGVHEGGSELTELSDALKELVVNDNTKGGEALRKLKLRIAKRVREKQDNIEKQLCDYVLRRGEERLASLKDRLKQAGEDRQTAGHVPSAWELGVKRVFRILGLGAPSRCTENELIEIIDPDRFADAVVGSLSLFSQMGLHTAHLVVMLYNIYKSDRMGEVILAGGVTQGMSGRVIRHQAEAFLAKYYDKVYGPEKNLKPGFLIVAGVPDLNVVGPYGAAMVANREHKLAAWVELNKYVEFQVDQLEPGQQISVDQIRQGFGQSRLGREYAEQCLERLVSESRLLRVADTSDQFVRPVGT